MDEGRVKERNRDLKRDDKSHPANVNKLLMITGQIFLGI